MRQRVGARRARWAVVAFAALALVASGCGDDDDDGAEASAASGPSVESASPEDAADHMLWSFDNETEGVDLAPADCATAQPGGDRFFLPVWAFPGDLESECDVPSGSTVIVNIGGSFCFDEPDLEEACRTEFEDPDLPVSGSITVDGEPYDPPEPVASPIFRWTPQEFWGVGTEERDAAYYGWTAAVTGLSDGEHTIVTEFDVGGDEPFVATVTHQLTVG